MNTTDPIADYLTRLRNAIHAKHKRVNVPASTLKREITKVLTEQKFITGYTEIGDNKQGIIRITLKYTGGMNSITGLKRVSRPGLRRYSSANELPRVLNGLGVAIISTSYGIMTDKQARIQHLGGEVLCQVW